MAVESAMRIESETERKRKREKDEENEKINYGNYYLTNYHAHFFNGKINNHIFNWERPHSSSAKAKSVIVILTERVKKTSGDINAAAKLIKTLKEKWPNVRVQWVIRQDNNVEIDPVLLKCADDAFVIDRWHHKDYQIRVPQTDLLTRTWFKDAALVLGYPQIPMDDFLLNRVIQALTAKKTRFLNCLEYDVTYGIELSDDVLSTGLGQQSLGVFLENFSETTVADLLQQLNGKIPLLHDDTLIDYQENHLFFFAYFNNEVERVKNLVNAHTFCATVAAYTKNIQVKQKTLDILCSFTEREIIGFEPESLFKEDVNEIYLYHGNEVKRYVNPQPTPTGRSVNIVSQFNFNHDVFIQFLLLAYYSAKEAGIKPFIGCTGDQSLCEVLSLAGAFPFYQIMEWKAEFAQKLHAYVVDLMQNNNNKYMSLAMYFLMVLSENRFRNPTGLDLVEKVGKFFNQAKTEPRSWSQYNHDQMEREYSLKYATESLIKVLGESLSRSDLQVEMEHLSVLLRETKNLYVNFPAKIEQIIHESYPHMDLTGENISNDNVTNMQLGK